MSLLMDALKKAEREREAQASKEQGKGSLEPRELSLDPIERGTPAEEPAPTGEEELWSLEEEGDLSRRFDLELDEPDLDFDSPADGEPPSLSTPSGLEDIHFAASSDEDIPLEDTASTMPSMKAVRASVDRYFDGSQSGSVSMSMPIATDEATTVVRQAREGGQTAARTVFEAKGRKRRSGLAWLAAIPIVLLLLAGGGYYYWTLVDRQPEWRSPSAGVTPAAPAPAPTVAAATTPTPPTIAETGSASEPVATTPAPTSDLSESSGGLAANVADAVPAAEAGTDLESELEPALTEVLEVEPPPSGDLSPPAEEAAEEVVTEAPMAPPEPPPSSEELLASADEQMDSALGELRLLEEGAISAHGVSITKRPAPNRVELGVQAGYQAFQHGDYVAAEVNYIGALDREPDNRDALLGIAALAVVKQRWAAAAEVYSRLLRMNPRDNVAQAALLSIQPNVDPIASETRLKLMLESDPGADYLYFSLGNLYASSSRWADAQGAFFDAFRLDSQNADYAYNLAVSLEHISKPLPALEYYRLALALSAQQTVRFSKDTVAQRIQALSKASS